MNVLAISNRQRVRRVNVSELRRIGRTLLRDLLKQTGFDIAIYLVGEREITQLNETYLHHGGSTDVITFDYAEDFSRRISSSLSSNPPARRSEDEKEAQDDKTLHPPLHGEIFICLDEAVLQARRFRTSWQSELVRYVLHGVLHLCGYDDQNPRQRRQMKRRENQLLRKVAHQHNFHSLTLGKGTVRVAPAAKLAWSRPRPRSCPRNRVRQKDNSRTRTRTRTRTNS